MDDSQKRSLVQQALEQGAGILRLAPAWVPRSFCVPGRRLRLHPSDLYALGAHRGGIDERWFSSTTHADNGPGTPEDEGLSYIFTEGGKVLLLDAMNMDDEALLGQEAVAKYGGWVMYSKFFDNMYALPHHIHQNDEYAAKVGKLGKPEAYFYPAQYNASLNTFPNTFFGFEPGTTIDEVVDCLKRWNEGDNGILELSKADRLKIGTGWYVAPGVLHAPGTLCTYEPQRASDVYSMWQSLVADYNVVNPSDLWKDVPQEHHGDYDYLIAMIDWDLNVDPEFKQKFHLVPKFAHLPEASDSQGYQEKWIVFGNEYFSAKELTVLPGRTVTVQDKGAYGLICVQGYGRFGRFGISAPTMIRFGDMTEDEFFVTYDAAMAGVEITNLSSTEPLVILKHFNPGNPDMPSM